MTHQDTYPTFMVLMSSRVPLVPATTLVLMAVGGVVYSIGAALFSLDGLRCQNTIWHMFVLTASICFCTAIALGVFSQG